MAAGRVVLLAAAVAVGQASVGWANDAVDADRDRSAGRRDKPAATGAVSARTLAAAAGCALVLDVPLSLAVGWRAGAAHLVAVGGAWLYDLGLKTTVASVAPYALSFGLLPVTVAAALPGAPRPLAALVGAAAAAGVAAHFANTVGDAADDAVTGVRGLPQRVGPLASTAVAAAFVGVAGVLLALATEEAPLALAAAAAAVVVAVAVPVVARAGAGGRRTAFRMVLGAVALLVAAFVVTGGRHLTG